MWDLGTMDYLDRQATAEYLERRRKIPAKTPLAILKAKLREARPPAFSVLLSFWKNADEYNDFVLLVQKFLPERQAEIIAEPSPAAQVARFASYFEDRYLPLYPSFQEGWLEPGEEYYALLRDMPVMARGFGWEDYENLNNADLGAQLMAFLIETPHDDGARVSLADGFPEAYKADARRLPAGGVKLKAARRIFKGAKWLGLRNWAEYLFQDTGNQLLDTDDEMRSSMSTMAWDKELVEILSKEWLKADVFQDKMTNFEAWLQDEKQGPARFKETIDYILAHTKPEDFAGEPKPQACSRGIMLPPRS